MPLQDSLQVRPAQAPKLLDRLRTAIRLRHFSRKTEEAYVGWVRRFILFHRKRHPSEMGEAEVTAFLTHLAQVRSVSASTQNQALCALLFLYKCVLLRVKDLDLGGHQIVVRSGKGQKDRQTTLPESLVERLERHLRVVHRLHAADRHRGFGRVSLPDALAVKYPQAATEWRWQFVFPAGRICRDPRWGAPSRYHLHESAVQRAVTEAARQAGLEKRVSCHTFRHYAASRTMPRES